MTTPITVQPINNYGLHRAALDGDDAGVTQALALGADINAFDTEGRTPIMCAVAGDNWQNLDASDASFMTADRLSAIRTMIRHPRISLHCLNAQHASANGVIPLSMAAWLNLPDVVRLLLEGSEDRVAVDGRDIHGATALMYAARDGSTQVVQHLLSHGARPDIRDYNFRSSIQYALSHPRILWLCENVLRWHRWRESQSEETVKLRATTCTDISLEELLSLAQGALCKSTSHDLPPQNVFAPKSLARATQTLISTVLTNSPDLSFLRSILFAPSIPYTSPAALYPLSVPILVNRFDERGWSPIHYTCSFSISDSINGRSGGGGGDHGKIPEIEALDTLYLAGADISLFTTEEHYTPLHILALTSSFLPDSTNSTSIITARPLPPVVKDQVRAFIAHLIYDLGAPLEAQDRNDETPLHIAAEHGRSPLVIAILLELDREKHGGRVARMRNARGLLARDLAKGEGRMLFEKEVSEEDKDGTVRRGSVSSALSSDSTMCGSERHVPLGHTTPSEFGEIACQDTFPSTVDVSNIDPMGQAQVLLAHLRSTGSESTNIDPLQSADTLDQVDKIAQLLAKYFHGRVEEAGKEVAQARKRGDEVKAGVNAVCAAVEDRTAALSRNPSVVSLNNEKKMKKSRAFTHEKKSSEDSQLTRVSVKENEIYVDAAIQAPCSYPVTVTGTGTIKAQGWMEWFGDLIHTHSGHVQPQHVEADDATVTVKRGSVQKRVEVDEFGTVEREVKEKEKEKGTVSGTSRFKTWLKKIVHHDGHKSSKTQHLEPIQETTYYANTTKINVVYDLQSAVLCPIGREPKLEVQISRCSSIFSAGVPMPDLSNVDMFAFERQVALARTRGDWTIAAALSTAPTILCAVLYDLERIEEGLKTASVLLDNAKGSVDRVCRVVRRALKKRRTLLVDLRHRTYSRSSTPTPTETYGPSSTLKASHLGISTTNHDPDADLFVGGNPGFLGYSLSMRPSLASLASVASVSSACSTNTIQLPYSDCVTHHDDEDTKTLRRLLLRRIEAQLTAAYDEIDRAVTWIAVLEDVLRGLRRRTYL